MRSTVLVVSAALGGALVATKNMNVGSKYMFDNPNPAAPRQFDTDFASRPASTKYFELYAGPIETRYGDSSMATSYKPQGNHPKKACLLIACLPTILHTNSFLCS